MRSTRRSSFTGSFASRTASGRHYGRVTKDDIRAAALRRWDGRARVTTDWQNLFYDSELFFATGDVFIYLREPGQSSRGPSFRVHKEQLQRKGFEAILSKCIEPATVSAAGPCMMATCPGCVNHPPPAELYMPAPPKADLNTVFDHHITTRNFFAWLYNIPLIGRSLGMSLIALKERIDFYRPGAPAKAGLEVVSFAEGQRYLDFRECMDHALAALSFAESLEVEDLWVDAFAHCVGLSHRGLQNSMEFSNLTPETQLLIERARLEMDMRTDHVSRSVEAFFEHDFSGNSLGFSQAAKDHLDRFRSWLHSFYIEQHGFWPPVGFFDSANQRTIYTAMYADFRNLYHHLMDPESSNSINELSLSTSGGVCTFQNVQSFDTRHEYEPLPHPLPLLPAEPSPNTPMYGLQRRKSWNPVTKRKVEKDNKNVLRIQSLIKASNRDWNIMACLIVRRYSEFEAKSIIDETETIPMIDGRKIRWILVYAILQTLISVMQAPPQVRNTEGLTYSLCCHAPRKMPWQLDSPSPVDSVQPPPPTQQSQQQQDTSRIAPDGNLLQTNSSSDLLGPKLKLSLSKKERKDRRQTLPARVTTANTKNGSASASRSSSLRRFMSRRNSNVPETPALPKPATFCEIYVQGYGNGLNEVDSSTATADVDNADDHANAEDNSDSDTTQKANSTSTSTVTSRPMSPSTEIRHRLSQASLKRLVVPKDDDCPELVQTSSASVSRESSNASTSSTWSKNSDNKGSTSTDADRDQDDIQSDTSQSHARADSKEFNKILDEQGFSRTVHINTKLWDDFLAMA